MVKKTGFTLIELVIVIVILGILAAVTLPKFANFKTRAIEKSEDAIAGAINTALKIYNTSYIIAGGDPVTYPSVNPFTLLEQAPPYKDWWSSGGSIPDNATWRYRDVSAIYGWYVYCPHWDGAPYYLGTPPPTKGRLYFYLYGDYALPGHRPGDFYITYDAGH